MVSLNHIPDYTSVISCYPIVTSMKLLPLVHMYILLIKEKLNTSDILSKNWGYQAVWPLLKKILFKKGNTYDLWRDDKFN